MTNINSEYNEFRNGLNTLSFIEKILKMMYFNNTKNKNQ